jgi:hypothetical protein
VILSLLLLPPLLLPPPPEPPVAAALEVEEEVSFVPGAGVPVPPISASASSELVSVCVRYILGLVQLYFLLRDSIIMQHVLECF